MFSIRCVTKKPPIILMLATSIAINAKIDIGSDRLALVCNKPPMMMMPLMALVTAMSGVCKE